MRFCIKICEISRGVAICFQKDMFNPREPLKIRLALALGGECEYEFSLGAKILAHLPETTFVDNSPCLHFHIKNEGLNNCA